jgi:hypothetical protein
MSIGIICLANGPYSIFINNLIESCEEKFLPKYNKEYFIITDNEDAYSKKSNCTTILKSRNGWPLDCLLRPKYSYELEDKTKHLDYTFFFNANIYIHSEVNEDILPDESGLVGVEHPHYTHRQNHLFTYDRNEKTNAYIPLGEGEIYYQACFWGGKTKNFMELSKTIEEWTEEDRQNGVEPVWLDESYLNKYFLLNPPKTLSSMYAWPESFPIYSNTPPIKIIQLEKSNYIQGNFKYKQ